MNENTIKREKGAMLMVAVALLSEGIQAINMHEYPCGIICITTALLIFYLREHYKFKRWHKT